MGNSMIGFFLKKAFFDGWDNLISLAIMNLGFIVLLLGFLSLPAMLGEHPLLVITTVVLLILLLHLYAGGVAVSTSNFLEGRSIEFRAFFSNILSVWKVSVVFGAISSLQVVLLAVGFPFYLSIGGLIGLSAVSVLFWFSVFWNLVSLWIFPVRVQLDGTIRGVLKKSIYLSLDNPGFTVFLSLYTLFNLVLSFITAFLIPGVSSILLSHQIAMKLRLYKYNYLEEHPDADRKRIPWDALLIDEKEKVGQRTLRGMIFPWKE